MAARHGKYEAILPGLKPGPVEDPGHQDLVEKFKAEVTDRESVALAAEYIKIRALYKDYKAILSQLQIRIDAYEQLLTASQEHKASGWGLYGAKENTLKLETGETIRIQTEPYGIVVDKEAFRQWCIDNGYERQLQLWPSTMNTLVKERLLVGQPEPNGCEAFSRKKVFLTKKGEE